MKDETNEPLSQEELIELLRLMCAKAKVLDRYSSCEISDAGKILQYEGMFNIVRYFEKYPILIRMEIERIQESVKTHRNTSASIQSL